MIPAALVTPNNFETIKESHAKFNTKGAMNEDAFNKGINHQDVELNRVAHSEFRYSDFSLCQISQLLSTNAYLENSKK